MQCNLPFLVPSFFLVPNLPTIKQSGSQNNFVSPCICLPVPHPFTPSSVQVDLWPHNISSLMPEDPGGDQAKLQRQTQRGPRHLWQRGSTSQAYHPLHSLQVEALKPRGSRRRMRLMWPYTAEAWTQVKILQNPTNLTL